MLALERGYRDFLLLGCTGGRLDHMMGNLAVLLYIRRRGGSALLADENNRARLLAPGTIPCRWRRAFICPSSPSAAMRGA